MFYRGYVAKKFEYRRMDKLTPFMDVLLKRMSTKQIKKAENLANEWLEESKILKAEKMKNMLREIR